MNGKGILLGAMLGLALLVGCSNQYQYQVDHSLLLQENQRLESALYVTHTQLVDLKNENDRLKTMLGQSSESSASKPGKPMERRSTDNYDEAPAYESPKVSIPANAPPSTTIPDALKGSAVPSKTKVAAKSTISQPAYFPPTPVVELKKSQETSSEPVTGPAFPEWSPSR